MTIAETKPGNGGIWGHLASGETIWSAGFWYLLATASLLWVFWFNGEPLYYFDTGGYLVKGERFLDLIGLLPDDGGTAANGVAGGGGAPDDHTVQGDRSLIYGVALALFHIMVGFSSVVVAQSMLLVMAVWLSVRALLRAQQGYLAVAPTTGLCIIAASLGAAPFYTAFLMPDIFAPILLLMLALLTTLLPNMRRWEMAAAFVLAAASVLMHPSHLLIVLVFVPMTPILATIAGTRRVVLSSMLVSVIALIGVTERFAFVVATQSVVKSEVTYRPFLTARLIVDGPGLKYLRDVCPQAGLATCDLEKLLVRPRQITASHIVFEDSDELGSFLLLPEETQKQITHEQAYLLREVLRTHPFSFVWSVAANTLTQFFYVNAYMTLPDQSVSKSLMTAIPEDSKEFTGARLTGKTGWLPWLSLFHLVLYGLSLATVIAGVFWKSIGAGRRHRAFAATVFVGILANSFVCGAISQPSDRYGARVIFLLPILAVLFFATRRESAGGHRQKPRTVGVQT